MNKTLRSKCILSFLMMVVFLMGGSNLAAQKALPYSYGFENNNLAGEGWTRINNYSNNSSISQYASHNSNYGYKFSYPQDNNSPQYLISPRLVMPANISNIKVSLWYNTRGYGYTEKFKVGYSTTDNNPSSFTWDTEVSTATTTWKQYETSISIPVTTKYIAIAETNTDALYVDDIAFTCNIIGRSFIASDGDIPFITDYSYSFGLALEGTTHTFTFSNPGTQSSSISVTHTGNFGVSLQNSTIPAGGSTSLIVTMPDASGSDVITISSNNGIFDDFDINVSGTVRDENKLYQNGFSSLPTGWTSTGSWNYTANNGANPYNDNLFHPSHDGRLITPRLFIAESEKFYVEANGISASNTLKLQYSADGSSWTDIATENNIDQSNWNIFEFNGAPIGGYYIAIYSDWANIRMYYGGRVFDKTFQDDGDWDDGWSGGAPTSSDYVCVDAACTIQNGTEAVANHIALSPNGSLTIEEGGQLICNNSVEATVKKSIEGATSKDVYGWYTISSPVNNVEISSMTGLLSNNYDLYRYAEASMMWENYKSTDPVHTGFNQNQEDSKLENGRGYLYRNSDDVDIQFTGNINVADVEYSLSYTDVNELHGFNLIGNPFTHDIYKGEGGAIDDTKLNMGFYRLSNSDSWEPELGYQHPIKPGEGILVQANEEGTLTITNTNAAATDDKGKANHDNIMFTVENSECSDITYAMFDKGHGLNKISHRNADVPMLYIPQNGENFAIAMMSDDTKAFDLNFKAMTTCRYTLRCKTKGNFSYLHLIDRLTGEDVDMLLEGEYSFIASKQDNENRFIVRLEYSENPEGSENSTFAWQNGSDIIVYGEGELQIFDVMGRRVSTVRVSGETTITAPSMQGVYIFKLNDKTQKIVVK